MDGQVHRLLDLLPADAGIGCRLRSFWATVASLDLRPLLHGRQWVRSDYATLDQVRKRLLVATHPFQLALCVLQHESGDWRRAKHPASPFDEWNRVLAVQRLLGRLETASEVDPRSGGHLSREIAHRREGYLSDVRVFQLIHASLHRLEELRSGASVSTPADVAQACADDVTLLLAIQHMLPAAWRTPMPEH